MDFYVPRNLRPGHSVWNNVTTEANDDWIDVYAGYDLKREKAGPDLTIILTCGDRSEFAFSYPLTEREQGGSSGEDGSILPDPDREEPRGTPGRVAL